MTVMEGNLTYTEQSEENKCMSDEDTVQHRLTCLALKRRVGVFPPVNQGCRGEVLQLQPPEHGEVLRT